MEMAKLVHVLLVDGVEICGKWTIASRAFLFLF